MSGLHPQAQAKIARWRQIVETVAGTLVPNLNRDAFEAGMLVMALGNETHAKALKEMAAARAIESGADPAVIARVTREAITYTATPVAAAVKGETVPFVPRGYQRLPDGSLVSLAQLRREEAARLSGAGFIVRQGADATEHVGVLQAED